MNRVIRVSSLVPKRRLPRRRPVSATFVLVLLACGSAPLTRAQPEPAIPTGPAVGEKIPLLEAVDQRGERQTFETLHGPNGLLLLFTRSADWCPYCKGQLVQLERQRLGFLEQGVRVAALTYDSVEVLRHFAARVGIEYPLLSDPKSEVIRAFGILNDTVDQDNPLFGFPYPGYYRIGPDGIVQGKYFEERSSDRFTAGEILVRELGADPGTPRTEKQTNHLTLAAWSSDDKVRAGNRIALVLDINLKPKMHVYAPGVEGYYAIEWTMESAPGLKQQPPSYPPSEMLDLAAIGETVPVYQNSFRLVRDVTIGLQKEIQPLLGDDGSLAIKGALRYQACDDKVCYLPQTIPVEWKIQVEKDDRTRVPENLQRK
jgi:peroxiredoxin